MLIFENKQQKIDFNDSHVLIIETVVEECIRDFSEKHKKLVAVSVIIVDDDEMRSINMQQRNIDKSTDVLSFPMFEIDPFGDEEPELDIDLDTGCILLGDIAICAERSNEQANEYGHSFEREIGFLVSHGVHHILGYDHTSEEDEKFMINLQENVLIKLNLKR